MADIWSANDGDQKKENAGTHRWCRTNRTNDGKPTLTVWYSFSPYRKNEGPTTQSRALVIQPRSLEIFEQMGIAEHAVKQGRIFQTINYVVNGKLAQRVPLGEFGKGLTQFPYLLILLLSRKTHSVSFSP